MDVHVDHHRRPNTFQTLSHRWKFFHTLGVIRDSLHWLPIEQRTHFKAPSLMGNCLVEVAPTCLRSLCTMVFSLIVIVIKHL